MGPQDEIASFQDESVQNQISKTKGFYKIDFNTHIIPRNLPDFATRYGYGGFITLDHDQEHVEFRGNARIMKEGRVLFEVPPCSWDVEQRIADMDRDGINLQVVSTLPSLFNYWAKADDTADLCRIINNDMKKVISQYPKRFVGLGTVPMQAPELAIKELRRCVTELDFAGVQIGAHVNEWNLDAPELAPFWEACEELNCCVFVNPWDMDYSRKNRSYNLPQLLGMPYATTRAITTMLLGGILDRFPKLRICFANGGGSFPYLSGRINLVYQAYPDKCAVRCELEPSKFLGRFACDSLVSSVDSLKLLINVIGENSVVFGTDYPLKLGETRDSIKGMFPGKIIEESDIKEDIKSKIYCQNAFAFLNKKLADFV